MYFTYVLQSEKDHKYYIGVTNNLVRRVGQHNRGIVKSTSQRRPLKLIYFEEFDTRGEALYREHKIKSYKGGNEFKKLITNNGL